MLRTRPYTAGMGDQLTLAATGVPSYQKLLFALVSPGYVVVDAAVSATYQTGDLLVGLGFGRGDAAAAHSYSPDIQVSRALHGSDTVISFGLGVATTAGTVTVSDLGPTDPLQLHLVLRPG